MQKGNIILIGMPGSGKSTIGPILAKAMGKGYLDTDEVIRNEQKREPKDIVKEYGPEEFLKIQENTILGLNVENHVIATGGSVVLSDAAMAHLKKSGVVIYLDAPFEDIKKRLEPGRRLARNSGQTFEELYIKRVPLYRKYADITINCSCKGEKDITEEITVRLSALKSQGRR